MAFFPFYPWLLRILARTLHVVLQYFVSERSLWMDVKHSFLCISSCIAIQIEYPNLFGEKNVALVSSLLFCFNPASVFMSSLYTESSFSCLQLTALWYLEEERSTLAVLLFGLGCATRFNGVLSCGYVTHRIIKHFGSNEMDSLKSAVRHFNAGEFTQSSEGFFEANDLQWHYTRFIFPLPVVWNCMPPAYVTRDTVYSLWSDKLIPLPYSYI